MVLVFFTAQVGLTIAPVPDAHNAGRFISNIDVDKGKGPVSLDNDTSQMHSTPNGSKEKTTPTIADSTLVIIIGCVLLAEKKANVVAYLGLVSRCRILSSATCALMVAGNVTGKRAGA
ncbi:hypothetical protein [Rhizobium sp. BK491]|uniref:hypothetical protein n=1 Tax=Rhizobium sp. BK491 TaxID=2587009 RepID=UPI0016179B8D|nr:hypothetical protein [Rhizobium sp. BK491]MBB3571024.1 hypothetical protein [Rhizobium sp. BK491]